MIVGAATPDREAIIRVSVRDAGGQEQDREALIDTGFNGWLSLPPDRIAAWRLPWKRVGRAWLADGSEVLFNIHEAVILGDGQERVIPIDEADTHPLVGMSLIYGYELKVLAIDGGAVTLTRIAP